jgi:hypothetical protein
MTTEGLLMRHPEVLPGWKLASAVLLWPAVHTNRVAYGQIRRASFLLQPIRRRSRVGRSPIRTRFGQPLRGDAHRGVAEHRLSAERHPQARLALKQHQYSLSFHSLARLSTLFPCLTSYENQKLRRFDFHSSVFSRNCNPHYRCTELLPLEGGSLCGAAPPSRGRDGFSSGGE